MPDGSTTGAIIELLRNMLVREYKNDLYFFSAVSPAWMQPGKTLERLTSPLGFGPVNAILRTNSGGWDVRLSNQFRHARAHVVIRIPWFYDAQQAEADGRQVQVKGGGHFMISARRQSDAHLRRPNAHEIADDPRRHEAGRGHESGMSTRQIERAQRRVEQHNFDARKQLLEYDDVAKIRPRHLSAAYRSHGRRGRRGGGQGYP